MNRTASETALLIKLLLLRSDQKRARISEKTIRLLGRRKRLKVGFVNDLMKKLEDIDVILIELASGGYGLVASSAFEGAPTVTAKKYLLDDLARIRKDPSKWFNEIRREVEGDEPMEDSDD
jgi:hypothetical protein